MRPAPPWRRRSAPPSRGTALWRARRDCPYPAPAAELGPAAAWSRRVRRIGGFIQLAFAAFWLMRAALTIGGGVGDVLAAALGLVVLAVVVYGRQVTAGKAPRPTSPAAKRIERSITVATVVELVAAFVLPVIVVAAGKPDWVLPSIAITIGPLLLWLDHLVTIPRYRPVGWALTIGPLVLVATMSGPARAVSTGLAAGALLLSTAAAGFHDLARLGTGGRSEDQAISARPDGVRTVGP